MRQLYQNVNSNEQTSRRHLRLYRCDEREAALARDNHRQATLIFVLGDLWKSKPLCACKWFVLCFWIPQELQTFGTRDQNYCSTWDGRSSWGKHNLDICLGFQFWCSSRLLVMTCSFVCATSYRSKTRTHLKERRLWRSQSPRSRIAGRNKFSRS